MTQLPGIAGEIEAAVGLDLAVRLMKRRGGTEITIPVRAKGSMLADIIGCHAAERLIAAIGPGKIMLPCGTMRGARARRAEAMRMLRAGASIREVALACDLHSRSVSNYRAEIEAEAGRRQMILPFDRD
ncbi:hypothetical protein [Albidovulum sp.]|uniref:hypothetical protein n=1 Tax=Albidovulum sp. TaxID=1872424 RepID=UPI0039B98E5B